MSARRLLLLLLAIAASGCASRQAGPTTQPPSTTDLISADDARALAVAHRQAAGAYFGGDLPGAVDAFSRALALNPGTDSLLYTLGAVSAEAGRTEDAYKWLERLAETKSDLVPQPKDFPGLSGDRFDRLAQAMATHVPRHGEVTFTLAERDLIPEGIAYDPAKKTFFVSSIRKRKVVAVREDGSVSDFVAPAAHGMLASLGMKVDAQRRHLWVASHASANMEGFTEADRGHAVLFRFDADSGRLLGRFPRQTPGKHLLNDVAIAADGTVYVTDSEAGEVLRLRPGVADGDSFEVVVPGGELIYPNGLALSEDGHTLYVADFVQGLTTVDLGTGARAIVRHPRGVTTRDIDGMYLHEGSLLAVQNGTGAGRVVRFVLSADGQQVVRTEVLEANHPSFIIPTTAAIAGDAVYVLANSQLRAFDGEGKIWPAERLHPVQIVRVPLR